MEGPMYAIFSGHFIIIRLSLVFCVWVVVFLLVGIFIY